MVVRWVGGETAMMMGDLEGCELRTANCELRDMRVILRRIRDMEDRSLRMLGGCWGDGWMGMVLYIRPSYPRIILSESSATSAPVVWLGLFVYVWRTAV